MKTTRIVLTIPEEHGGTLRAEARRLQYDSPQNLLLAVLRGDVQVVSVDLPLHVMKSINIPPASPGRKKGKQ
jgi:hypothetical protein